MNNRIISDERLAELWEARLESRRGAWTAEQFDEACEHLGKGVCRADYFAGAHDVLEELGVGLVMEITSRKDWPACPIRDNEPGECEAFRAMFRLKDIDVPTTCPAREGDSFVVSPQCPFYTLGAVLVRAKK